MFFHYCVFLMAFMVFNYSKIFNLGLGHIILQYLLEHFWNFNMFIRSGPWTPFVLPKHLKNARKSHNIFKHTISTYINIKKSKTCNVLETTRHQNIEQYFSNLHFQILVGPKQFVSPYVLNKNGNTMVES